MAVDGNVGLKKNETSLFTSWTLGFYADAGRKRKVLAGYIRYISDIVVKERRWKIFVTSWKSKPAMSRKSWRWIGCVPQVSGTCIQRLHYSLEIANAAGDKRPVYSNGGRQDDPDFRLYKARMVFPQTGSEKG